MSNIVTMIGNPCRKRCQYDWPGAFSESTLPGEQQAIFRHEYSAKLYSSVTWVQGPITGINHQAALSAEADSFIGQEMAAPSIVLWLENDCSSNPQDHLADAAEALVVELRSSQ